MIGAMILLPLLLIFGVASAFLGVYSSDDSLIEEEEVYVTDRGFTLPFKDNTYYMITSNYGGRIDPINRTQAVHHGIDIGIPIGTDILSVANGKVILVVNGSTGLGNHVYISHNIEDKVYISVYGHMKNNSIVVKEGQIVNAKDKIGIVGNTGRVFPQPTALNPDAGTHLHFELHQDQRKIDGTTELDPTFIFKKDNKK